MAKSKNNHTDYSVLLDTSFMIRLLNENEPLHPNALGYYKYFLDHEIPMCFSTISIAEYCVKGDFYDIPYRQVKILPFNIFDAKEAGRFARAIFDARSGRQLERNERKIIINDTKLFAQASVDSQIKYFVTADTKSKTQIEIIRKECGAEVEHLDIHIPCNLMNGTLDL